MSELFYKRFLFLIFGLGIVLRVVLFFINPSLFADESALAMNIYNKSFFELFSALDFMQASPVGFTIIVKSLVTIFNPSSDYWRDLVLRIFPLISGILVLPLFYFLVKLVFKENKRAVLTSLFFVFLNPCAIYYSVQLKQYSTELFISVLLLIFFCKMVFNKEYKWWYSLIFAICPWFSYSSFFVLSVGFFTILISDRKLFIKSIFPLILSCLLYYFMSLRYIFADMFIPMKACWEANFGFLDIHHPLRILLRYGDIFANSKLLSALSGFIFFTVCIVYLFMKESNYKKFVFVAPIFLTLIASLMHKYAIQARLILFLLPMFGIIIASVRIRIVNIFKIVLAVIIIYSMFIYDVEASGNCYSYSREIVDYVAKHIEQDDVILLDASMSDYNLYLAKHNLNNKVVYLTSKCLKQNLDECKMLIDELPNGTYYFLSLSYYVKELTEYYYTKELDVGIKPKRIKAIYFKKG